MPEAQIHLFTGENLYALEKELQRWKKAFSDKHGPENLQEISGKDATVSTLLDAVSTMPFIAEKRLVVIRGIPRIEKEDFRSVAEAVHPQVIVVIADAKPDKRLSVTKEVTAAAELKSFPPLSPMELYSWAKTCVSGLGSSIDRPAFDRLLSITGEDQWVLDSELRKLADYSGAAITVEHVDELAVPSGEQVVWKLTDLIGSGRADAALAFLRTQLDRGEDPYGLWVILLNMIKNLALVWSALDAGLRDERSISSAFSMHFLSVRGLLPLARTLDRSRVKTLVMWASDADIALKTGGYHYASEHQQELVALTERAIMYCRSER